MIQNIEKPILVSGCGNAVMRDGAVVFRDGEDADWLLGVPPAPTTVPRERRICFVTEPPMVREYRLDYLNQFGTVISPYDIDGYNGRLILDNLCVGWLAGSSLDNFEQCRKTKEISFISSFKKKKYGHRRRVIFMYELMKHFGNRIDYFGRDLAPVKDKFDAIAPYKYHIAVENCSLVNYWTEKLADAWIAWSLPIYCGDPSILRKVPDPMGIEVIDIGDIPCAIRHIEYILKKDIYSSRLDAIAACREWAIKKTDPKERVCDIIESSSDHVKSVPKLETPESLDATWKQPNEHTVAGEIKGAASWCLGTMAIMKIKSAYKRLNCGYAR
jgi:hypothetical protein